MKQILYITEHNPFGVANGAQQRSNLIFKALQTAGHVHLFCISEELPPEVKKTDTYTIQFFDFFPHPEPLKPRRYMLLQMANPNAVIPIHKIYRDKIKALIERQKFDVVFVRYIQTVLLCGLHNHKGLIVDVDDLPQQYYYTMAKSTREDYRTRFFNLVSALHAHWHTKSILRPPNIALFSNPTQVGNTGHYLANIPFPNDYEQPAHSLVVKEKVLFVGNLNYSPNKYGVHYFITKIWPAIRKHKPNAILEIAGVCHDNKFIEEWRIIPGVKLLGYVQDLAKWYSEGKVVVVPITTGAGTHIKLLEAMKHAKACVITPFAARGGDQFLSHRENVIIASDARTFAQAVIQLLENDELNLRLGIQAASTIDKHFSYHTFEQKIVQVISITTGKTT